VTSDPRRVKPGGIVVSAEEKRALYGALQLPAEAPLVYVLEAVKTYVARRPEERRRVARTGSLATWAAKAGISLNTVVDRLEVVMSSPEHRPLIDRLSAL
jgi:hypothetical protein